MKQIKQFLILILSLSSILFAQERMILRTNGEKIKITNSNDLREAITETKLTNIKGKRAQSVFPKLQNTENLIDTISYREKGGSFNTNFGFFGQDVMMMWFEAEAHMNIKAIGFTCSDDEGYSNATVSLRLVRFNWTKEQLLKFDQDTYMGYYPSTGDGYNESDYFGEKATGNWVSKDSINLLPPWTNNADPVMNTFDYNVWMDAGYPWLITPVVSSVDNPIYNWLDLSPLLGSDSVTVKQGEIFALVVTHNGTTLDSDRIGFWSDNTLGYPGWKYYENGRLSSDEPGWWVRMYTWDFALAVDITGDRAPKIEDVTIVGTSHSNNPKLILAKITDDNPSGGPSGVVSADLVYIIGGNDTVKVPMETSDSLNYYVAEIPAPEITYSTKVIYWVEAEDVNGNVSKSFNEYSYTILIYRSHQPLLVFNGYTEPTGFPQSYYFGNDSSYIAGFDVWSYGPLTKELVDNYHNIFEITTTGPNDDNYEVIREWLNSDTLRNYFVSGDEWLNLFVNPWEENPNTGDFIYDIFGITKVYYNISNYSGFNGYELPTKIWAKEGTILGDSLYQLFLSNPTDSLVYDPYNILGIGNWIDGFEVLPDVEVFMRAESRGIVGAPKVDTLVIGCSRVLPNGNKVVFTSFDPFALTSTPDYFWYGNSSVAPHRQALLWFEGILSDIDDDKKDFTNIKFTLSQNYPNPFNPSTTIKYSIPDVASSFSSSVIVTLKIYDILGREAATLVNKEQKPGNYEVQFDASHLSSGIYFYKLNTGSFVDVKKMMVIK